MLSQLRAWQQITPGISASGARGGCSDYGAAVRVIGGTARGRKLRSPEVMATRPTSDRVRESIFDILEARDLIEDATVLDLFAGSGGLGIEALSRGASSVTFVDNNRTAIETIRANLASIGFGPGPGIEVLQSDGPEFCLRRHEPFDVAFLDPPYAFKEWAKLLDALPAKLGICESSAPIDVGSKFNAARTYRYGTTLITIATPRSAITQGDTW